jgi:NADH-quinone oxidoreductase subunit G
MTDLSTITITIDGTEKSVSSGSTVLQACQEHHKEIPVFCYHKDLKVAGNCRMCLVELEGAPKPIASCAYPVQNGMVINTQSDLVQKARKTNLEFLLINHPLDCPICDQGGECDLQDETMAYGLDRGCYQDNKRAVQDKDLGPLIKTVMTRCIHCTRCVRFANDVAGVEELGAIGRGENMEIVPAIEGSLTSELSGNMIDLCPVGALTSKPYAFTVRSWELTNTPSIDIFDGVGSSIYVDHHNNKVDRIRPRPCAAVNGEWISDKVRFAYDGLSYQRLDQPYGRDKNGQMVPLSWNDALAKAATVLNKTNPSDILWSVGDTACLESMALLKKLGALHEDQWETRHKKAQHSDYVCTMDPLFIPQDPSHYTFAAGFEAIDHCDSVLMIGTNLRTEAPVLNARLRSRWLSTNRTLPIHVIGDKDWDLTYPVKHVGSSLQDLSILEGDELTKTLGHNPLILISASCLQSPYGDGATALSLIHQFVQKHNIKQPVINMVHTGANRIGALMTGYRSLSPKAIGQKTVVYALNQDNLATLPSNAFVIYQGHHGDAGAKRADLILPGSAFSEKSAHYVNMEGRRQRAQKAVPAPGLAKEDWRIIKALSNTMGLNIPVIKSDQLPVFLTQTGHKAMSIPLGEAPLYPYIPFNGPTDLSYLTNTPLRSAVTDFYRTDPISRSSPTMAKCSDKRGKDHNEQTEIAS